MRKVQDRDLKVASTSNLLHSGLERKGRFGHHPDVVELSGEEVLVNLGSTVKGLAGDEAARRLERHGANDIQVEKKRSLLKLVVENFGHPMALLLWLGGAIGLCAQLPQLAIAIWLVNIINGTFSFIQEYQAERATRALKKLLPVHVTVLRDGKESVIEAQGLVPGDVFLVREGDKISADARVLDSESLEVDQSTLTGESRAIRKSAVKLDPAFSLNGVGERSELPNLLFAGTEVLSGNATAVVIATGVHTEFGKIARLTQCIDDEPSPLQKEMARVTRIVTVLAVSIGIVMFALACSATGHKVAQAFIFAMGMIVAFVPEGMLPTVTLSLAMAVKRMARRNALVKKLSSVETLGCTSVICTDKTGTLTENRMTVKGMWAAGQRYSLSGDGYSPSGDIVPCTQDAAVEALMAAALCNNANFSATKSTGDPVEISLLVAAAKAGLSKDKLEHMYPRVRENPFDSRRKCMSTVHVSNEGYVAFAKGSPLVILDRCSDMLIEGKFQPLTDDQRISIKREIDEWASDGLRVLAVARKSLAGSAVPAENGINVVEDGLSFLGLFAMLDPPRREVPDAVEKCKKAGIRVVMITGDYEVTAEAIARRTGIISGASARVITGSQMERISDQELTELVTGDVIFARVNPEHKLRVVRAFQNHGLIVAVTGDGVNDAPALKKADIGIAMGVSGTDVARGAADMILLNDNFASIVDAVEEGRAVYENIKKFAVYVFNSNMAEAVPFAVMLFSHGRIPLPLTVMQVLSIDLGTDMVPAIALGADTPDDRVMSKPPRDQKEPLLSKPLLIKALLWYGAIEAVAGLSCYFFFNWLHGWPSAPLAAEGTDLWRQATTMTLAGIVACQVAAVFCCRTQTQSIFSTGPINNRLLLAGIAVELVLLAVLMYVPAMQSIFDTAPIGVPELLFVAAWPLILILFDEVRKLYLRRRTSGQG